MSAPSAKGPVTRVLEVAALVGLFALMLGVDRLSGSATGTWQRTGRDLAAIGFFLLAGTLASSLLELLRSPT
jgi:hypothetical protein